jgi:hypothetical protein
MAVSTYQHTHTHSYQCTPTAGERWFLLLLLLASALSATLVSLVEAVESGRGSGAVTFETPW